MTASDYHRRFRCHVDRRWLIAAVVLFGTVVAFGFLRQLDAIQRVDRAVAEWVPSARVGWLTPIVNAIEAILGPFVLGIVVFVVGVLLLWLRPNEAPLGWRLACVTALSAVMIGPIKQLIAASRPDPQLQTAHLTSYGYPSGHTATDMAIAVVLYVTWRSSRPVLASAALAGGIVVALGRIYLNAHYTTDVIGGGVLAASMCLAAFALKWDPVLQSSPTGNTSAIEESESMDA